MSPPSPTKLRPCPPGTHGNKLYTHQGPMETNYTPTRDPWKQTIHLYQGPMETNYTPTRDPWKQTIHPPGTHGNKLYTHQGPMETNYTPTRDPWKQTIHPPAPGTHGNKLYTYTRDPWKQTIHQLEPHGNKLYTFYRLFPHVSTAYAIFSITLNMIYNLYHTVFEWDTFMC